MKAVAHVICNTKLVAEGCHDLPAFKYEVKGFTAWDTVWQPTPDELVQLNAGGLVVLTVLGVGHPPVKIGVM